MRGRYTNLRYFLKYAIRNNESSHNRKWRNNKPN